MSIFALALMLAHAACPPADPITVGDVARSDAVALAPKVLPPEIARRIVGGVVRRWMMPGHFYGAVFWEASAPIGPMLCRRRHHATHLSNPAMPGSSDDPNAVLSRSEIDSRDAFGTSYPQPASRESCARITGYAAVSADRSEATAAAIERLNDAMRAAAGPDPLPFALDCRADAGDNACAAPRSALANLPLEAIYGVAFDTGAYRTLRTMPGTDGGPATVVRQMVPHPDGRTATPTIQFGMAAPDGRSWRVTLVSENGRTTNVRLSHTMVIYH
jgi:hypothetical protein